MVVMGEGCKVFCYGHIESLRKGKTGILLYLVSIWFVLVLMVVCCSRQVH